MAGEQYHLRVLVSSKYFLTLVTYSFYTWYFSFDWAINLDGKQTVPKLFFFCLIILPNQFGFIFLAACNRILSCELQWHHYCQLTNRSEFLGNDFGAHFEDYYQLARNRIVFNQANILRTVRFAHHLYYW